MTKATEKQLTIMEKQYTKMLRNMLDLMVEYRSALVAVVRQADLKTLDEDSDFLSLGKDAFLYKLHDLYEYNKTESSDLINIDCKQMDSLMQDVRAILNDKKL